MTRIVLSMLNGLTLGGLLFLVASGFTLIFGLMRVLNLAHGAFYLWGGYTGLFVMTVTGSFWVGVLVAGVAVGAAGGFAERLLFRRVRGNTLAEVLLTVGLGLVLGDTAILVWGGDAVSIRASGALAGGMPMLGVTVPRFRIALLVMSILVFIALWALLTKTRVGAVIRAGVDDREMLAALGVNVRLVFSLVFVFGAFLAGASGVVGGTFLGLYPGADAEILLFALVVVVIGGLGSLWGALIGSMVVGLLISFGTLYVPEILYFVVFGPMLAVLVLRPQGLLGRTL